MVYKSEADHWRELFEQQKAVAVTSAIVIADLQYWNVTLAEETLRIRETNRVLREQNANLRASFFVIAWFVMLATIWNVM